MGSESLSAEHSNDSLNIMNGKQYDTEISTFMKLTNGLVQWSPCGGYVAIGTANRLILREQTTFHIVQQYVTIDMIQVGFNL